MVLLFVQVAHIFNRPNGLDCADEKMSLELRNGKNVPKSKVLTSSAAMTRLMFLMMLDRRPPSLSICSAQ